MVDFLEVIVLDCPDYSTSGGPTFSTNVFEAASGIEYRNSKWTATRRAYNLKFSLIEQADMATYVRDLFLVCKGQKTGFRFRDPDDYYAEDQLIGTGDGSTVDFQLIKTYSITEGTFTGLSPTTETVTRTIKKVANNSLTEGVLVNGVSAPYTIDETTGIITMDTAPALGHDVVVPIFQFHVPVRFKTDEYTTSFEEGNHRAWNFEIIELLEV